MQLVVKIGTRFSYARECEVDRQRERETLVWPGALNTDGICAPTGYGDGNGNGNGGNGGGDGGGGGYRVWGIGYGVWGMGGHLGGRIAEKLTCHTQRPRETCL
ncbi:hypothetical protein M0802_010739 [Mischocyttarus mexicanus]|nr:hypothetical protein M0802_010739 [Mischocyttarus mexicanus]